MYRSAVGSGSSSGRLPTSYRRHSPSWRKGAGGILTPKRGWLFIAACVILCLFIWSISGLLALFGSSTASSMAKVPPSLGMEAHRVVYFAIDKLSELSGASSKLTLDKVISYESTPLELHGQKVDESYDMKVLLSEPSSGRAFEHEFRVNTDSSGYTALTKYTASYDGGSERYETMLLPGSTVVPTSSISKPALRTLSFNLWNYNHWEKRLPLISEQIQRLQPDVIAFQEVRAKKVSLSSSHRCQVEDLANILEGYQFVYQPAMLFRDSNDIVHEGLAVFSRFPILESDSLLLTRDEQDGGDFHQRICLRALIQSPLGPVHVMSTHLSLSAKARRRTIPEIAKYAASLPDGHPAVLMGDFNAEAQSGVNLMGSFGFVDCWLNLYPDQSPARSWTFNSWFPKSRIDYVFAKGIRPVQMTNEGSIGVDSPGLAAGFGVDNPHDTLFVSDHMLPFVIFQ